MPVDLNRLVAEIKLVSRESFRDDLKARMEEFFRLASADLAATAAKTTLAQSPGILKGARFARDMDTTVVLYLLEDHATLKIHLERMIPTSLVSLARDVVSIQAAATDEMAKMERFAKRNSYKILTVNVNVSLNEAAISDAQRKLFWKRFVDVLNSTSLWGKFSGLFGTLGAALALQMDVASAIKSTLAGLIGLAILVLVEAGRDDALKFERR